MATGQITETSETFLANILIREAEGVIFPTDIIARGTDVTVSIIYRSVLF